MTGRAFDSVTLSFDHFAPEDYEHGYVAMVGNCTKKPADLLATLVVVVVSVVVGGGITYIHGLFRESFQRYVCMI